MAGGTFETGFDNYNDTSPDFNDVRADTTPNSLRIAKAKTREKNRGEWTSTLKVNGNPKLVAGCNIQITGFGVYDGKYHIEQAVHRVDSSSGYTTEIKCHKVLKGY